jgi:X-Pro dipeptidyl-peptidase-like protein
MRRTRLAAITAVLTLTSAGLAATTAGADPGYTVTTLHFAVTAGPSNQHCDIVGDLYAPAGASSVNRVPAVLTTNGFGGSKDGQAGIAKWLAGSQGYAVLSYSGLGFGGSGCKITLDDPDWDGVAASQLVSFLGGQDGNAFTDAAHTQPVAAPDYVVHDATDHDGTAQQYDPRIGMVGGSYGGEIQFAAASVDKRIDALIPLVTWNDLSYSLTPNNTALTTGVTSSVPGSAKIFWALLFFTEGAILENLERPPNDPSRLIGCPNFPDVTCPGLALTGLQGFPTQGITDLTRHASVSSYLSKIKVPVLLGQGQHDTLFNLNEAAATYTALKAQGTPVKMIWQAWGHSGDGGVTGEVDLNNPDPAAQYEVGRFLNWFDHYLKDEPTDLGPDFAYFRPWVPYTGNAAPAYASADSFPVGTPSKMFLSGNGSLVTDAAAVKPGSHSMTTTLAGLPTSFGTVDGIGVAGLFPDSNLPGTYLQWTSPAMSDGLNVAGSPQVDVKITSATAWLTKGLGPIGEPVVFAKVYDVAPDGSQTLINDLVAPARVEDLGKPVKISLPAFVHRFEPGHQVRLILAGGDVNHRGAMVPIPLTVAGGSGQTLTLPVVA